MILFLSQKCIDFYYNLVSLGVKFDSSNITCLISYKIVSTSSSFSVKPHTSAGWAVQCERAPAGSRASIDLSAHMPIQYTLWLSWLYFARNLAQHFGSEGSWSTPVCVGLNSMPAFGYSLFKCHTVFKYAFFLYAFWESGSGHIGSTAEAADLWHH